VDGTAALVSPGDEYTATFTIALTPGG
jgi:hypothetical protein